MTAPSRGGIGDASFAAYWERIRLRIQGRFQHYIPELFDDLPDPQLEAVLRSLEAGKRIRGCLVCLACEALGGDVEAAMPRAVGIECLHAASLIHDDVVDGDAVRRDRPAEWSLQGARRAVLLGDVMFSTVIHRMAERSMEEGSLVARVIATMAKGAYQENLDRSSPERPAGEGGHRPDDYETIIHLKTGVLFGAAAQLGAMVAAAPAPAAARAFTFGARLGEAYQMADDLVDVEFPQIERRMRTEISARCASAVSALVDFPDNPFTRLLHEMPADVIRSMDAADRIGRSRGDC